MPSQLRSSDFDALIHSPLARAAETARIVWGDREGPVTELPTLREVDLYAMQVCLVPLLSTMREVSASP